MKSKKNPSPAKHANFKTAQAAIEFMVFEPGLPGESRSGGVAEIADAVGHGNVQMYVPPNPATGGLLPIVLACHDEGRLRGLAPNRWGVRGTFVVAGRTRNGGLASLTDIDRRLIEMLVRDDFPLM